jgi:hypothetical protein
MCVNPLPRRRVTHTVHTRAGVALRYSELLAIRS